MKITLETTRGIYIEAKVPDTLLCDFLKLIAKTTEEDKGASPERSEPTGISESMGEEHKIIDNQAKGKFLNSIETLDTWVYVYACEPRTVEDAVLLTAASFKSSFTVKQLGEACKKVFNVYEDSRYLTEQATNTARAIVADPHFVGAGQSADSFETLYEISVKGWARCWEIVQDRAPHYFNARVNDALKRGVKHTVYL